MCDRMGREKAQDLSIPHAQLPMSPQSLSRVACFFDGACPGNQFGTKGRMKAAYVIGEMEVVCDVPDLESSDGPKRSNNIAEYFGLIFLLRDLRDRDSAHNKRAKYLVCGDSELVIRQLRGEYRVRAPHLRELQATASELASGLDLKFREIPREENPAGFLLARLKGR